MFRVFHMKGTSSENVRKTYTFYFIFMDQIVTT